MNLKQIKFVNGEEIICDVVEEYEEELVVRNALKLTKIEVAAYVAYYSFRPWITMKNDISDVVLVNSYHIICAANPSEELHHQYVTAVESLNEDSEDSEETEELSREENSDSATNVVSLFRIEKDKMH